MEVALLLLHCVPLGTLLIAAAAGVVVGAWQSVCMAGVSAAGHRLRNSPAVWENSWNSGSIRHGVVRAEVGRTAVFYDFCLADGVVFEVLFKNTFLNQPVLEPELLKIYANNF